MNIAQLKQEHGVLISNAGSGIRTNGAKEWGQVSVDDLHLWRGMTANVKVTGRPTDFHKGEEQWKRKT